jgi:hypothetical protein
MCQNGVQSKNKKSVWELLGAIRDGARKRERNARCAQKLTRSRMEGKADKIEGCRGAEQGWTCTNEGTVAVA